MLNHESQARPRLKRRLSINFVPALSPFALANPFRHRGLPEPLCGSRTLLTFSARHALWNALKLLRVRPDENILMPSYCCGSEVLPVLRLPATTKLYRVRRSMDVDLDHIDQLVDSKTRALFIIHYAGFPQRMEAIVDLCSRHRICLIEDCAHALHGAYQKRWLGTFGEIGIFSLRKTYPLSDGGALLIRDPSLHFADGLVRPPLDAYIGKLKHLVGLYVRARLAGWNFEELRVMRGLVGMVKSRRQDRVRDLDLSMTAGSFDPRTGSYRASRLTEILLRRVDPHKVVARRRKNFQFLLERLDSLTGVRALHRTLAGGVCPLFFPAIVPDSIELSRFMVQRGIEAIPFWSDADPRVPEKEFPDTYALKRSILAIPIHQDLRAGHLQRIVDTLHQASRALSGRGVQQGVQEEPGVGGSSEGL